MVLVPAQEIGSVSGSVSASASAAAPPAATNNSGMNDALMRTLILRPLRQAVFFAPFNSRPNE